MSTAPYPPAVASLLTQPHEQRVTATAVVAGQTIPLEVTGYRLDAAARRTPRIVATITCGRPDVAGLALLDPRRYVRLVVTAGYRLPSGDLALADIHLMVKAREITYPDGELVLTACSHELAIIEQAESALHPRDPLNAPFDLAQPSGSAWIKTKIDAGYWIDTPYAGLIDVLDTARTGPIVTTGNQPDGWDEIEAICEAQALEVYDDGYLTINIAPRVEQVSAESAAHLTHGQAGTIIRASDRIDRDEWANFAAVRFRRHNATLDRDEWTYGTARVTAGPYATSEAGWRHVIIDRDGSPSPHLANNAAAQVLSRMLERSRSLTIQAPSAWWLRPGHTITVHLPDSDPERHLVAAVEHTTGGVMTVTTRTPDPSPIG